MLIRAEIRLYRKPQEVITDCHRCVNNKSRFQFSTEKHRIQNSAKQIDIGKHRMEEDLRLGIGFVNLFHDLKPESPRLRERSFQICR